MRTPHVVLLAACTVSGCLPLAKQAPAPQPIPPAPVAVPKPAAPLPLACIQHPSIDVWERRLRSGGRVRAMLAEPAPAVYLPHVRRSFRKAGLPTNLALLPVVESEYNRSARGRADEMGLWQFRGATAERVGLVVRARRDQRLHPYRATRAAARLLRQLHRRYGDWPLAIAAYNAGEQRLDTALARQPHATFWQLADAGLLPHATREYVPRFLAVVRIVDGTRVCGPSMPASRLVSATGATVIAARREPHARTAAAETRTASHAAPGL